MIWVATNAIKVDEADGVLRGGELERYRKLQLHLVAVLSRIQYISQE